MERHGNSMTVLNFKELLFHLKIKKLVNLQGKIHLIY